MADPISRCDKADMSIVLVFPLVINAKRVQTYIGCPRIIRTLYFDVLKEGENNFMFRLYAAAWST